MAIDLASAQPATLADRDVVEGRFKETIRAFSNVALALREVVGRDDLLHLAARKMCELVYVSRCSVYLRDAETGLYRGQVGHAGRRPAKDVDAMVRRLTCGVEADGFTREIVRLRQPVVVKDARRDPRTVRSVMRDFGVRSMLGVPMVLRDEVIGIFFLDSEEEERDFSSLDRDLSSAFAELAAAAMYQEELVRELRESNSTVGRQNQALRRAAAVDERFTELVAAGGSLREIAEAVNGMTGKPCMICDPELQALAVAAADSSIQFFGSGAMARAELEEKLAHVAEDKTSVVGPFPGAGIKTRLLLAPVTVRDTRLAILVLGEVGGPFGSFDRLICRRVAGVIAVEMSAERRAARAEWNARAALAAELIHGNRDVADVERRANFLGVSLDTPRVIALVSWRDGHLGSPPDTHQVAEAVQRRAPGTAVLGTGVAEGIALILELPAGEPVAAGIDRIKETLSAVFHDLEPDVQLVSGLSIQCVAVEDYARAFEQARSVLACIDAYGPPGALQVLSADDLGPGRLLLAGADNAEAHRFTEESIGPLLADAAPSELLETVASFLENNRSVRQTAAALGIHENTVRYRFRRIEQLTGKDLANDSAAQLSAQVALLFLRLRSAETEEPRPGRPSRRSEAE